MLSVVDLMKESPDAAVKLLPCDYEVMGSSSRNNPLQKCREKTVYIGPKVVGPFPRLCASRSYVHRAALFSAVVDLMEIGKWKIITIFGLSEVYIFIVLNGRLTHVSYS
jgi:hypothetical protein